MNSTFYMITYSGGFEGKNLGELFFDKLRTRDGHDKSNRT